MNDDKLFEELNLQIHQLSDAEYYAEQEMKYLKEAMMESEDLFHSGERLISNHWNDQDEERTRILSQLEESIYEEKYQFSDYYKEHMNALKAFRQQIEELQEEYIDKRRQLDE